MKFGTLKQCLYYPYFIANNKLHPFIKWQCPLLHTQHNSLKNCIILIRISLLICYVKLIQRCLKNYETATSTLAIDNKNKSKFTGLACGIKLTNPCKACWFHNNFVKLFLFTLWWRWKEPNLYARLLLYYCSQIFLKATWRFLYW